MIRMVLHKVEQLLMTLEGNFLEYQGRVIFKTVIVMSLI